MKKNKLNKLNKIINVTIWIIGLGLILALALRGFGVI